MFTESPDFDPYHKWLGIPASDQPPNHYRLLGLALFESDPDVVAAAADRQMAHVKSFASGRYADYSQLLLNELSKARVCLLNPKLKLIYDAQLTKMRARENDDLIASLQDIDTPAQMRDRGVNPQATPQPRPSDSAQALDAVAVHSNSPVRRRRRRRSPWALNLMILLCSAPIVAGLLWYAKVTAPTVIGNAADRDQTQSTPDAPNKKAEANVEIARRPDEPDIAVKRRTPDQDASGDANLQALRPEGGQGDAAFQKALPPGDVQLPGNPFGNMPYAISLPDYDAGPVDLGNYDMGGAPKDLRLTLLAPDHLSRVNRRPIVHRHRETDTEVRWLVFDDSESTIRSILVDNDITDAKPIAMLRAKDSRLSFAWLPEANAQPDEAARLQQCLLQIDAGDARHDLQLSVPVEDTEAIVIGNWDEKHEFQIVIDSIPSCPPTGEMYLRLHLLDGFPTTRSVNGNSERLAADEKLLLSFTATDYAGLGVYWEAKGKLIVVNFAPGFRLLSYPGELQILSRDRLDRAEKRLDRDRREAARDYTRRVKRRAGLNNNLTKAQNINITLPGGGTTVQLRNQKNAAIAAAQGEINANESRIDALSQMGPLVSEDEQTRLPALRSLSNQLEGNATLGFELYTMVGNREVVLYRKGLPAASNVEADGFGNARSIGGVFGGD